MNLSDINARLSIMDISLANAIATGDLTALYEFNVTQTELSEAIYGNYRGLKPIHPTYTGHLHVEPKYYYLLSSLK